jgi:hypothetical protein
MTDDVSIRVDSEEYVVCWCIGDPASTAGSTAT